VTEVDAATAVSAIEDICSTGNDHVTNHVAPQQVQLERQCMAANLNIAATARGAGDCRSVSPDINTVINGCCNGANAVCNSSATAKQIDDSGCIGLLDRFNNLETTINIGVSLGAANPGRCQASRNNGFLNPGRNRLVLP
jgi:hypothetical protein